jgi:hypothetical protein
MLNDLEFVVQSRTTYLQSLVPVFFQALCMEIQRYLNACYALTDYEPVVGLIAAFVKTL